AVWRAWFDWRAPVVTTAGAPSARALPSRNSSLRVLLPPSARPVQSSRLSHTAGPPRPAWSRRHGSGGVGRWASATRGNRCSPSSTIPAACQTGAGMAGGTWYLGVDLGTTYTAAAVRRGDHSEVVTLGTRSAVEPTVAVAIDDGLLVGEAAERRAATHPERTVRQFKRRLGDTTPVLLGG